MKTNHFPSPSRSRQVASSLIAPNPRRMVRALVLVALLFGLVVPNRWASTQIQLSPAQPADLPASVFGVEMNPLDQSGGLDLITQTETTWVRGITISWAKTEAVQGTYDWLSLSDAAQELATAQSNGLTPIVLVHGVPTWAQTDGGAECGPIAPGYYDDFANFIAHVITDTNSPLQLSAVNYWSIWNEPDTALEDLPLNDRARGCWGDPEDAYYGGGAFGDMLTVVYPRLKQANPQAQLIAGELLLDCDPVQNTNCASSKFLEGILRNNGAFDGLSFHAYDYYLGSLGAYENENWFSSWDTTGPSLLAKAHYVRQLLDQYGYTSQYLMNTENALLCSTCTDDPDLETTKAWYLMESYSSAIAEGLVANIWFDVTGTWGRNNGLLSLPDLDPLEAFSAYQVAAGTLAGAELMKAWGDFPGVTAYEFRNATCAGNQDCHIWTLWSMDGDTHPVILPAEPSLIQTATGSTETPVQELNIGPSPRYIEMPAVLPRLHMPIMPQYYFITTIPNNGDFESGLADWSEYEPIIPVSAVTTRPINPITNLPDLVIPIDTTSVLLGNPLFSCTAMPFGPNVYGGISQSITVPHTDSVLLTFKYIIYTQDASVASIYDRFEVYINNSLLFYDGNRNNFNLGCSKWWRVPSPDNPGPNGETSGWATGIIDLRPYRGQTITISFRNYSRYDANYNTYTYLDDIALDFGD